MMTLALRMGRTVGELMETMTAAELMLWRAFDQESPISDRRGDVQAAQIATAVLQSKGAEVKLQDVVLQWAADPAEEPEGVGQAFLSTMMALAKRPEGE